ncbi:MAG: sulfotransferase [Pseudomonadota bacterium]
MIVFSYGITKTGSTLAFELIKGCLESVGQPQRRLDDGLVEPGHPINFLAIRRHTPEELQALVDAVPADEIIAVKTHDSFAPPHRDVIERGCRDGLIVPQVVHRDPRDTCLSMLDAGTEARKNGRQAFSEFLTIEDTKDAIERQLRNLDIWLQMPNVLELQYDELVDNPFGVIGKIGTALGITPDPAFAHNHAFNKAFTQKNKAKLHRYLEDMSPDDQASVVDRFRPYMERHGYVS